jgi:hypothetical protein
MLLVVLSHTYLLPKLNSRELWQVAWVSNIFLALAVLLRILFCFRARFVNSTERFSQNLSKLSVVAFVVGASPYFLIQAPLIFVNYPPVAMLFSRSNELVGFYEECMKIRPGDPIDKVLLTMSQFHLTSRTPRELVFNTTNFSADFCSVDISMEEKPRVKSTKFELD